MKGGVTLTEIGKNLINMSVSSHLPAIDICGTLALHIRSFSAIPRQDPNTFSPPSVPPPPCSESSPLVHAPHLAQV